MILLWVLAIACLALCAFLGTIGGLLVPDWLGGVCLFLAACFLVFGLACFIELIDPTVIG